MTRGLSAASTGGVYERRRASVGCLVTDGHTVYALTNLHVCGKPGTPVSVETRGGAGVVGHASAQQLARLPFTDVYRSFPAELLRAA